MSNSHAAVAVEHASEHGLVHHHFDDLEQQREATGLGMWAFLATETMMFGGLFFVYSLYRLKYHAEFIAGSHSLNVKLGFLNTLVLLVSSLTMATAVHWSQMGNRKKLVTFLSVTWLLGFSFLFIKGIEWTQDWHEGLVPALQWFPHKEGIDLTHLYWFKYEMFFVCYFIMAGLHAIHMIGGLCMVGYWIYLAKKGHFDNGNDQAVELLGLYWHFIDIVWVFLFPMLYLIGNHNFGAHY